MARTKKRNASDIAAEMVELRTELVPLEEAYKARSKELLAMLKSEGRSSEGVFHKRIRQTLAIADEERAQGWAATANCLKIDTTKAWQIIRRQIVAPESIGFAVKETEYIGIGAEKENDDLGVIVT